MRLPVALPQLLELFAPDFLVDFAKDIGHVMPRSAPSARPTPDMARGDNLAIWQRQGKAVARSSLHKPLERDCLAGLVASHRVDMLGAGKARERTSVA